MDKLNANTISPLVIALGVACVILVGLDLSLSVKVRRLIEEVSRLEAKALEPHNGALSAGQSVQPMVLLDPQGGAVPLSFEPGNGSVLLLISSGSCQYCDDARPIWDQIAHDFEAGDLRVLGLVLDTAPDAIEQADVPYKLYAPGGDAQWLMSRIAGVPTALLIGEDGVVVRAFYGEQTGLTEAVAAHMLRSGQ